MSDELTTINKISKMITSKDPEMVQLGINLYKGKYTYGHNLNQIKAMLTWKAYKLGEEYAQKFLKELHGESISDDEKF